MVICSIGYMWSRYRFFFVFEWLKWFLYYYYCITFFRYKELATKLNAEYIIRSLRKVVCLISMFFFKFVSLVSWFHYCCSNDQKMRKNVKFQHCFFEGELTTKCACVLCVMKQLQYVFDWVLFYSTNTKSCYSTQVEKTWAWSQIS
jgi:hypothetical protein